MSETKNTLDNRPWGFWPTLGFGIAIIVAFFITAGLVYVIVYTVIKSENEGLISDLAYIAGTIVMVGLVIVFIIIRRRISIREYLGLKPTSTKSLLLSLAIVTGLIIANDTTCIIVGRPINPQVMVDEYNTSVWPALLWIEVVVFASISEETFFRGFLFKGFSCSRLGVVGTAILTSLGWTLLHSPYEVFELVSVFVSGIALGIMRYKTGSLWTPLVMHSFSNIVATLEVALNVNSLFG